jgi:hypothetical protein
MESSVGHAKVMLRLPEVELVHRRHESGGARRSVEQDCELLCDVRVLAGRGRDHVVDTLPHLVEPVRAGAATAVQGGLELCRGSADDERGHCFGGYSPG